MVVTFFYETVENKLFGVACEGLSADLPDEELQKILKSILAHTTLEQLEPKPGGEQGFVRGFLPVLDAEEEMLSLN